MADRFSDEPRSPPEVKEDWRRTIYCGGLRYESKEDAVKQFFEDEYGSVASVKIITDRENGNSRGYCFVTFTDERDAQDALATGTGKVLDGAPIRINVTRSQLPRAPFPHRGRGRSSFGFAQRRFSDRGGPEAASHHRGRDYSPDDRYSPPPRGRSRSPADPDSRGKRRRRGSPSFSRSPYRSVSRSLSRSKSRSRSPRRGGRSRSPPGPARAPAPPKDGGPAAPPPGAAAPAAAPVGAGGSAPASTTTAAGAEIERLRQSEAERAARCRKLEGELERERIMAHELEGELAELRSAAKGREEALRRHRDLLRTLSSGVGRLVAARQEVKAAEDAVAASYAEAASYMERTAPEFAARRRGGGEAAGEGPAPRRRDAGEADPTAAAAAMAAAYQQQYHQYQQFMTHQAAAMAAAGGGGGMANGGGGGGAEHEEGGWRESGDMAMNPMKFSLG